MDIIFYINNIFTSSKPPYTRHNIIHISPISSILYEYKLISRVNSQYHQYESRLGIDSHADMSCAGKHCRILEVIEGNVSTVHGFADSMAPMKNIKTVNVALAYDTTDGQTYILRINHCLDFTSHMKHSILCTNQCRAINITVDDVPKLFDYYNRSTQSILHRDTETSFPILFLGPIPYLPVREPTDEELETCIHIHLTSPENWDVTCYPDFNTTHHIDSMTCMYDTDDLDSFASIIQNNILISSLYAKSTSALSPESLCNKWKINLQTAKRTLECTSHNHIRSRNDGSITRRFKTSAHQKQYRQLSGYLGEFASDTFKSNVTSLRGNKYFQLFANKGNFTSGTAIKKKSDAPSALDRFLHDVGIPSQLLTDGAKELHLGQWGQTCQRFTIPQKLTEPYSPWQNHAELAGGIIKRKVRNLMRRTNTFVRLWDYCWDYCVYLRSITAHDHIYTDSVTPFQKIYNYSPDISEFVQYEWFEWVHYFDPNDPQRELLGRWLGPAHSAGQGMASHVLTQSGTVVTRSTIRSIPSSSLINNEQQSRCKEFMENVDQIIGNNAPAAINNIDFIIEDPYDNLFHDENDPYEDDDPIDNEDSKPLDDVVLEHPSAASNDKFIGCEVKLPVNGEALTGSIRERKRNADGMLIGTADPNPLLDSRIYIVDFPDGSYREYSANIIVENIFTSCDSEGRTTQMLKGISDHRKSDDAIPKENGWHVLPSGGKRRKITTDGWELYIDWADGTSNWIPLKDIKQSNPIEAAEYARAVGIDDQPAFAWWVNYVLKKRDAIVNKIKTRRTKRNMKFGVIIPSTPEEALKLDRQNKNSLWDNALKKELSRVRVSFQLFGEGEHVRPGYKQIPYHIIFDVKFDLTRKARLVAGGHRHRDVPSYATYSSVVSRDTVRIMLLIASLNNLKVLAGDVGNAYLNAPCKEKVYVKVGPELFGPENAGKYAYIVRSLYGLRLSGNAWHEHLNNTIRSELGYSVCEADQDVYMRIKTRADGTQYWSYIVCYVDDILCIDENPKTLMSKLGSIYRMKEDSISEPSIYLGANVRNWTVTDNEGKDINCWALGSQNYIRESLRIVDSIMEKHNLKQSSTRRQGRNTPFSSSDYRPELESSNYCSDEEITIYQNLIGMLRWLCELGRVDILYECTILSQYMVQPRIGHLTQALNIFKYLKTSSIKGYMVMDPYDFDIDWIPFRNDESPPIERSMAMAKLYPDAFDELPPKMPIPLGNPVNINCFVDSDHAGNKVTRRSHTGVMIFVNMAPITWLCKKQNTVETSSYGSEFIALRSACEMIDSLRYKLRMLGVPLSGPARIMCDNTSVIYNGSFPESTIKKKHLAISYHRVREFIASGKGFFIL